MSSPAPFSQPQDSENQTIKNPLYMDSGEFIMPPSSPVPTTMYENPHLTSSMFQSPIFLDPKTLAPPLPSQGFEHFPLVIPYLPDFEIDQSNIAQAWSLGGGSMENTELTDGYSWEQGMKMGEDHETPHVNTNGSHQQLNINEANHRKNIRCSCKKSQCVKLYCSCFSKESYCDETCACEQCNNLPTYAEAILGLRERLKMRNPRAFTSKIAIQQTGIGLALYHARGCNCKNSMCVKKYCECYQADVRCSDGCLCWNCKNACTQNDDFEMAVAMNNNASSRSSY